MNKSAEHLAKNLDRVLTEKLISKTELCREAGIQRSSLDDYLEKKTSPTLDVVDRIAAALRIPTAELLAPPDTNLEGLIDADKGTLFAGILAMLSEAERIVLVRIYERLRQALDIQRDIAKRRKSRSAGDGKSSDR